MPFRELMRWEPERTRWFKMYKGCRLYASCHKLGTEPTQDASRDAANAYFERKRAEIDADLVSRNPPTPQSRLAAIVEANPLETLYARSREGKAADRTIAMLEAASVAGSSVEIVNGQTTVLMPMPEHVDPSKVPSEVMDEVFGLPAHDDAHRLKRLAALEDDLTPYRAVAPADRKIGTYADAWIALQRGKADRDDLSPERANMNRLLLMKFVDWFGKDTDVGTINEMTWANYHAEVSAMLKAKTIESHDYANRIMAAAERFIRHLWIKRLCDLPRSMGEADYRFKTRKKEIILWTLAEVRRLYARVSGQSTLHLHLMLNCGMNPKDVNDLQDKEVNWKKGTITRKRSKTKDEEDVPVVTYKLWPETFSLLQKHRSGGPVVLLTEKGNRWITRSLSDEGLSRSDCISSNLKYFKARCKPAITKETRGIRRTMGSFLGEHPVFKSYAQYFLGQSPKGMTDGHYVKPSDKQFFAALEWLRAKVLPKSGT